MYDQAFPLRQLASRTRLPLPAPAPKLIAVLGGGSGVGCSTIAWDLACELSEQGQHVVAVDFAAQPGTWLAQETPELEIPFHSNSFDLHAALRRGPLGMQVLPNLWQQPPHETQYLSTLPKLMRQLQGLGRHAEFVVVDCGNISCRVARELRKFCQTAFFVTSTLAETVTRTYTLLKAFTDVSEESCCHWVLNRWQAAEDAAIAERFRHSCRRFLSLELASSVLLPQGANAEERREQLAPGVNGMTTELVTK